MNLAGKNSEHHPDKVYAVQVIQPAPENSGFMVRMYLTDTKTFVKSGKITAALLDYSWVLPTGDDGLYSDVQIPMDYVFGDKYGSVADAKAAFEKPEYQAVSKILLTAHRK